MMHSEHQMQPRSGDLPNLLSLSFTHTDQKDVKPNKTMVPATVPRIPAPRAMVGNQSQKNGSFEYSQTVLEDNSFTRTHSILQSNIQALFSNQIVCDITLVSSDKKNIMVHRAILAAHSEVLRHKLVGSSIDILPVAMDHSILYHLMKLLYFGAYDENITPDIALGILREAREYGIAAVQSDDLLNIIVSQLTFQNCVSVLQHPELEHHSRIAAKVCEYSGRAFLELLSDRSTYNKLLRTSDNMMLLVIGTASQICRGQDHAHMLIGFLTQWAQVGSVCDLLKQCKHWHWAWADTATPMFDSLITCNTEFGSDDWQLPRVKQYLGSDDMPVRYVRGQSFDWCVRLDHEVDGKLRLVYESATCRSNLSPSTDLSILSFPAAMFVWQVMYKGVNIFHEKPVFICFPQGVSLHWSTMLPLSLAELSDHDEISISCQLVENPLVSLILYHFSTNLETTVQEEDILNRLPHIEFRCVSSYMLLKQQRQLNKHDIK